MENKRTKKILKRVLGVLCFLVIFGIAGLFVIAYYIAPLVEIRNAETGDEMIYAGDWVYAVPKDSYEKGDIVLVDACEPEVMKKVGACKIIGHATRKVVALPDETVPMNQNMTAEAFEARSQMSDEEKRKTAVVVSTTLTDPINNNTKLYGFSTPVTDKDLISIRQGILPKSLIYGVVYGIPSNGWEEAWKYFVTRTKYFPEFLQSKL
jgi:hypothetical protein